MTQETITTTTSTYNGWTNYETWCVALWMDNERAQYEYYQELAKDTWDAAEATPYSTREQNAKYTLADVLKDQIEDTAPAENDGTVFADLLNAALSEVNWHEIADHYLADLKESN